MCRFVVLILGLCSPLYMALGDNGLTPSLSGKLSLNVHEIRKDSFKEWKHWKERYPQCDPERNPYTSPIKIDSRDITSAASMKGIFIHSKLPVDDCLSLSILYKKGNLEIEAVTLNALPNCSKQLTYISGGGDKPISLKYFKRAIFFFTNTESEVERSLHQVSGKQFQMEIAFEFVGPNEENVTQIFTLVEAKPAEIAPANPIFTALEPALAELTQEIATEASQKTERAVKYKKLEDTCSSNEQKYLKAYRETKDVLDSDHLKRVKTIISNIRGVTNNDLENQPRKNSSTETLNKTENASISEDQKLVTLREQKSNIFDMLQEEKDEWALDKLQALYDKVEYVVEKLELRQNGKQQRLEYIREILIANKVGIPGEDSYPGMLYKDPDAVHRDLLQTQNKIEDYIEARNLYNESCHEFIEFQKKPYALVRVNVPFQISWLFPDTGGYYLYNGSSPVPDCEPRDTTIVFEKPISISNEQLSFFQNLPSLENMLQHGETSSNSNTTESDGSTKVDKMIPIIFTTEQNRKVWYVAKTPVYLDDDGFHGKSSHVRQGTEVNDVNGLTLTSTPGCFLYVIVAQLAVMGI